jgi:hypothetical protein
MENDSMDQHNDTLDARKRRRETLQNGEYIAFDLSIMDGASASKGALTTDAAPGSVDSALVAAIEAVAKANQMKPSEWLAKASSREIQQIIESTAKSYVGELSAAGIANGLALDSGISARGGNTGFSSDSQRVADRTRMLAAARYNQAIYDASKAALNSWRGGTYAAEHQARTYDAESARETLDTLRKARYS